MRRKISSFISLSILLSIASGCSDELKVPIVEVGDGICFEVSEADGWLGTRSEGLPTIEHPLTVPFLSEEGDSLYVHITCTPTSTFTTQPAPDSDSATRGELITESNLTKSIGLFGYSIDGDGNLTLIEEMNNVELTCTEGKWTPKKTLNWGSNNTIRFIAYYPYNESSPYIQIQDGKPTITYQCDETKPENNPDILVATTDATPDGISANLNKVKLKFRHPLASIIFQAAEFKGEKQGFVACNVKELKIIGDTDKAFLESDKYIIENAYDQTKKEASSTDPLSYGSWNNVVTTGSTEAVETNRIDMQMTNADGVQKMTGDIINSNEQTFMVIPETQVSEPKEKDTNLSLSIEDPSDASQTLTLTGKLPLVYQEGYTTLYSISNRNSLQVESAELDVIGDLVFPFYGTTEPGNPSSSPDQNPRLMNVTSKGTYNGKDIQLAWTAKIEYDKDDPTKDWLTFPTEGVGNEEIKVTVKRSEEHVQDTPHTKALQKATPAVDCDLSMIYGTMNTANCYVVNAPGTYMLPLIYGNAIKNGSTNDACGLNDGVFVKHDGTTITDPKIEGATKAVIVWQDYIPQDDNDNVIVKLQDIPIKSVGDYQYLCFEVRQKTIMQSNAVLAVTNENDDILWSWHIWITDYKPGENLITIMGQKQIDANKKDPKYEDVEYELIPTTLGYCSGPNPVYYYPRKATVILTQPFSGKTKTITIHQQFFEKAPNNNTPFYQWGRKDPFVAATYADDYNTLKTNNKISSVFDEKNEYLKWHILGNTAYEFSVDSKTTPATKNSISFPYRFYTNQINWYTDKTTNKLWDMNISSVTDDPIKTLYDPSPVGFMVPRGVVFNKFMKSTTPSPFDANSIETYHGAWLYCNGQNRDMGLFFLPASGRRNNGKITDVGEYCMLWLSGSQNDGKGRRYRLDNHNDKLSSDIGSYDAKTGCPVISVKEKDFSFPQSETK